MRRILFLTIMCAVVLAFTAAGANAVEEYADLTGKSCLYCHVNPSGGVRNAVGQYYGTYGTLPPPPTVTAITPSSGPNTGTTSITNLAGTTFLGGATVKLRRTGYTDITASSVSVVSMSKITCVFNLSAKKLGSWDVVVTNIDALSGTLPGGFGITVPSAGPVAGAAIRALLDPVMAAASLSRRLRVWGKVELIDLSRFWLDDGSGTRIKVFAPGYLGLANGNYASATGGADVTTSPPTLISSSTSVVKH